ncbi:hypothetical protein D3C85_916540 [compost metagenome]
MFIAAGDLGFQIMDEGDVHLGRDDGHGQFGISRIDGAVALGVRVHRGVDQVAVNRARGVLEGDGAVDARVAVVQLGLVTGLDPGGHAQVAARQGQEIRPRNLEVPQRQAGLGVAPQLLADGVQSRLAAGRAVAEAGIVQVAAVERVVGVGRRQGELLLQRRGRDVVADVLGAGLGIEQGAFPVPTGELAAQTAQGTVLLIGDVDLDRTEIVKAIAAELQVHALDRGRDAGQAVRVGRAVRQERGAEGVVIAGLGDGQDDRGQGADRRLPGRGFGVIIAKFAEGLDAVVQLVLAGYEEVQAFDLGHDGQTLRRRV